MNAIEQELRDGEYGEVRLKVIGKYEPISDKTIVYGVYKREDIPEIIEQYETDMILIPSVCPETFSYATSEAIMTGLPVACFKVGAPEERVSKYKRGLILPNYEPKDILNRILSFLKDEN